ncbi:MAG: acyl-CoA desaturase [Chitinophagaceae bacterium]|jgi:linoleoyl-CoA desaturase|nr:acyl-CoA desaturase [Chitinophagaceae bacterium]
MDDRKKFTATETRDEIEMETLKKPTYRKGQTEAIFRDLRRDAMLIKETMEPAKLFLIRFKAFLFPLLYIVAWVSAMTWGSNPVVYYSAYLSMGVLLVLIYLNVIHDAVHHTIFRSRWMNEVFVYFFDIMGANSFIWKNRHVRFHHNYPNVNGWDTDIEQSPLARVYPHGTYSRFHKYQHIYLPVIYPLFLFNWLIVRDFKDFFGRKKIVRKLVHIPTVEYVKLFFFKGLFFAYMIFIPKYVLDIPWGQVLGAFVAMVFTASIFALMVLLPPHANTENEFPLPGEDGSLPNNWFEHMLRTTNDVTHDNWFIRFFMGSFNYHVVHHLFPNINHVYYPAITRKFEEYVRAHNLPYRKLSLGRALKNHYILLKQNRAESIWEEDM